MASILEKLRNLTLGNLHELLDAAINLNSIASVRQYVRDLEDAKGKMVREAAIAKGRAGQIEGEIAGLNLKIATDTEHADLLLSDDDETNDGDAQTLMERVVEKQLEVESREKDLAMAKQSAAALQEAANKIVRKHTEMVRRVRELESMERQTTAKQQAADALKSAAALTNSVSGASVDNIQQRMQDRSVAADAELSAAMSDMGGGSVEESVTAAKAKALIAQMRAAKPKKAASEAAQ